MTIHPSVSNLGISDISDLSDDLSFKFSPSTPGGPIGTEPGFWLANSPNQGTELQYLMGQQKLDSFVLSSTPVDP